LLIHAIVTVRSEECPEIMIILWLIYRHREAAIWRKLELIWSVHACTIQARHI